MRYVTDLWGTVGEETARKHVRDMLWFWKDDRRFTLEDLLSLAWSGQQPWLVKLEGEPLQSLVRLVGLKNVAYEDFSAVEESASIGARLTLFRLAYEGRLGLAISIIRNPEIYGPVGDVLDLRWTKEGELDDWIEASETSWSAYNGVKRLRERLIEYNQRMPDALTKWATEVDTGARKRPVKGHRPTTKTYRNRAIVFTIYDLTATASERRAGIKKVKKDVACELIYKYLGLALETVQEIWQKRKSFQDPWLLAPTLRPFIKIRPDLIPVYLEQARL